MSAAPTTAGIADAVRRMHAGLDTIRDELNAADRVMGDGDTGMTVADVVTAWHAALANDYAPKEKRPQFAISNGAEDDDADV